MDACDGQRGRVVDRLVVGVGAWIGVYVRTDDRQIHDRGIQRVGERALRCIGGKESIGMERELGHGFLEENLDASEPYASIVAGAMRAPPRANNQHLAPA